MRLCERNLADIDIGLWPFPTVVPSVGVMLGVAAHVQAAQFGRIEELRALLDDTPELIDRANDRGMTALMAAAHGGHTAVVTMLLEQGGRCPPGRSLGERSGVCRRWSWQSSYTRGRK